MRNHSRIDQADQAIEDALVALSRAVGLLGFGDGKEVVQDAHLAVVQARRLLHQDSVPDITRPQASAGWASSSGGGRALAALALAGEPRR